MENTCLYKFSLIIPTIRREFELDRCLHHLRSQKYSNLEVLIVDQNTDDRVERVIGQFPDLPITRFTSMPGVSRARNVGLKHATGDIIGFPDDDCCYKLPVIAQVNRYFNQHPGVTAVTGRSISNEPGQKIWKWDKNPGRITKTNIWLRMNSNSLFIRKQLSEPVPEFNELLGVGAGTPFGAAEEVDLVLKLIERDLDVEFDPELIVWHPDYFPDPGEAALRKTFSYAGGDGYVVREHHYSIGFILYFLFKPFANTIRNLLTGKMFQAKFMWAMFTGRIKGLIEHG
jgi:glycosyltransferase involved in cell wall biosynthesis